MLHQITNEIDHARSTARKCGTIGKKTNAAFDDAIAAEKRKA